MIDGYIDVVTGNEVTEFVCADEYQEDYSFDCPLEDGSRVRSDAFSAAPRGAIAIVSLQTPTTTQCYLCRWKQVCAGDWVYGRLCVC